MICQQLCKEEIVHRNRIYQNVFLNDMTAARGSLFVSTFCLTAGKKLCHCQYKAPDNIQETSRDPQTNFYRRPSLTPSPG